jgi:ADP-ribosyl-[dinitrogen reductase] hydrolase
MSSGYTVHTLEAAAWSFLTTESYEEAVARAANLGHDADTVAAVCGALAGAYYGYATIPSKWRRQLQSEARIREIALALGKSA